MEIEKDDGENIISLLHSWQMPEDIIAAFRQNGITLDDLGHLNSDHLKEICPQIGNRIKLTNKINEYLESKTTTVTVTSLDGNSTASATILEDGNLSFTLNELFNETVSQHQTFPDFDLKTLLETSPCGKSIINYYNCNGSLDTKRKNRLTDVIIRHLFTHIINKRLTYDDYNILSGKIITLFPKEAAGTYFTRPVLKRNSSTGKSIAARGKLIDKVRNYLFQSDYKKQNSNEDPQGESMKKKKIDDIISSIHEEDIEWLKNNTEPWEEVLSRWQKTMAIRHDRQYTDVHDFITQWKVLQLPSAPELIEHDFAALYPDKVNRFKDCWKLFMNSLIDLKKEEINSDETKKNLFMALSSCNPEDALPMELSLLVNIIPPKGRISKFAKISTQECLDSIMVIVKNPGDINAVVQKQIDKAAKRKIQVQPYVILLGSQQKVDQCYIVIDDIKYAFNSAAVAFDILFKTFHVMNARYPRPSDHVHLIIQRCVYNISTRFDNPVPYIADILAIKI